MKWNPELVSAPSLTGCDGRNFREKGFGVFSTWMKTLRAQRGAVLRSRVVAARMVSRSCGSPAYDCLPPPRCGLASGAMDALRRVARAVKLQRPALTARVPGQTAGPELVSATAAVLGSPLRALLGWRELWRSYSLARFRLALWLVSLPTASPPSYFFAKASPPEPWRVVANANEASKKCRRCFVSQRDQRHIGKNRIQEP